MAEVLVVGPDSEREFILFELQQLLDHCLDDTMKILMPVLCEHVPLWAIDLQIKSAQRLYDVVLLELDPDTANMITCASFGVIHRSRGRAGPEYEELYNLWGGLLVDCLPNMKWSQKEIEDVITLVDIHSKEQLFTSRKVAARVIGALAQCLDKGTVEKAILPRAIKLFNDPNVEVRGTVVESLATIGAALPIRVTETEVWSRVDKLLEASEEARIRATAMRTMSHILEAHRSSPSPNRLFRELLPPVFSRLADHARKFSSEDQRLVHDDMYLLLEVMSEVFGQFAYSLALFSKKSFRKEAYKAYAGMATCNGPLIRRNCAFNFPGVAKALGERYAAELSGLCDYLANDMDEQVRWILAAGIHETAALLAPRGNFERLFGAVCQLLQDESPMVRLNALAHFHDLLSAFAKQGSDPTSLKRLAPVFTDLTVLSEGEWRIQQSLAEQLGKCAEIIPPDSLIDNVLPLLYRLTKEGTPLVRKAAMDAIVRSLRSIPSLRECNIAAEKYWRAASKGPFWMRLAMLDGGASAMKVFSHHRFAEIFAADMLRLANDPVVNVRIRLTNLLAKMAPMCYGSPQYVKAVEVLRTDTDVDILDLMHDHEEAVRVHMKEAREMQSEDQAKFKEEQEFYGLSNRAQKRVRGRLGSTKGNRLMQVRRPSLEQSSGQLSVSRTVSSAADSVAKPVYQLPRLGDTESPLYLLPSMEKVLLDGVSTLDVENQGMNVGAESTLHNNLLSTITGPESGLILDGINGGADARPMLVYDGSAVGDILSASNQKNLGLAGQQSLNGNVPVIQQTLGKTAHYEARSKSWNGIIAQFPRQLSLESRSRRNAGKGDGTGSSGWNHPSKDGQKRKLSALRRKKVRSDLPLSGNGVDASSEGATSEFAGVVEHAADGSRVVAARAKSMMQSVGLDSLGGLPKTARISGAENPHSETDASFQDGKNKQGWKSSDSKLNNVEVRSGAKGGMEERLPSFRGYAPWLRSKHEGDYQGAMTDVAHRKVPAVPSHGNGGGYVEDDARLSKHGRISGLSGQGVSGSSGTSEFSVIGGAGSGSTGSVDGHSSSGGSGLFVRLFRRRR